MVVTESEGVCLLLSFFRRRSRMGVEVSKEARVVVPSIVSSVAFYLINT